MAQSHETQIRDKSYRKLETTLERCLNYMKLKSAATDSIYKTVKAVSAIIAADSAAVIGTSDSESLCQNNAPVTEPKYVAAYFIDHENTGSRWLNYDYLKNGKIYLLTSAPNAALDQAKKARELDLTVEIVECSVGGKNALDFQLTSLMGYKIAEKEADSYIILSNDKSFGFAYSFWREKGVNAAQVYVPDFCKKKCNNNWPSHWDDKIPPLPNEEYDPAIRHIVAICLEKANGQQFRKKCDHYPTRIDIFKCLLAEEDYDEKAVREIYTQLRSAEIFKRYFHH